MDPKCDACNFLKKPQHQVLTTASWAVGISNNQAYFGRAYVTLRTHKGSLSELSPDDWQEFEKIVRKLEPAYKEAFGATPLNWSCFMNHAFRTEPDNPHVHWHIFPRYKVAPVFNGVTYDDPLYGNFYDDNAERLVSDEVVEQIVEKLEVHLN
jgi:diadenosine tetraphosphate (Ap4A) HIT family hydrolase